MGVYTGTIPTFLAGELPSATKFTEVSNFGLAATTPWTAWTPTLTNLTLGNGTQTAIYRQLGKTVDFYWQFVLGSTSTVGTSPRFTLPVAPASRYTGPWSSQINDASVGQRLAQLGLVTGSTVEVLYVNTTLFLAVITATVPFTWTTSDGLICWGIYEAA